MFKLVKRDLVWAVVEEATGQDVTYVFRNGSSYAGSITARGRTEELLEKFARLFSESFNLLSTCEEVNRLLGQSTVEQSQGVVDARAALKRAIDKATRMENATD